MAVVITDYLEILSI